MAKEVFPVDQTKSKKRPTLKEIIQLPETIELTRIDLQGNAQIQAGIGVVTSIHNHKPLGSKIYMNPQYGYIVEYKGFTQLIPEPNVASGWGE